ncbi:hypothetical protein ARMSODRAFT_1025436 [Armillaria solidipes]|uniref:Uncharacterized protein n=1 Tax=Armillaria solidipes TaxID=1076256 RepID=A0A2H3BF73_9AGAR|nr:hypothetical protein ARMSODRAFT_1025436 [Armillaria solidipes]
MDIEAASYHCLPRRSKRLRLSQRHFERAKCVYAPLFPLVYISKLGERLMRGGNAALAMCIFVVLLLSVLSYRPDNLSISPSPKGRSRHKVQTRDPYSLTRRELQPRSGMARGG